MVWGLRFSGMPFSRARAGPILPVLKLSHTHVTSTSDAKWTKLIFNHPIEVASVALLEKSQNL